MLLKVVLIMLLFFVFFKETYSNDNRRQKIFKIIGAAIITITGVSNEISASFGVKIDEESIEKINRPIRDQYVINCIDRLPIQGYEGLLDTLLTSLQTKYIENKIESRDIAHRYSMSSQFRPNYIGILNFFNLSHLEVNGEQVSYSKRYEENLPVNLWSESLDTFNIDVELKNSLVLSFSLKRQSKGSVHDDLLPILSLKIFDQIDTIASLDYIPLNDLEVKIVKTEVNGFNWPYFIKNGKANMDVMRAWDMLWMSKYCK